MYGKQELWTTQFPHHRPEAKELNSELLSEPNPGADQGDDAGVHTAPPPPPSNDLQFCNIAGILQNIHICMMCILRSSHYVIV